MIKISKESKVFILAPSNVATGGAEYLHFLADILNNEGINTFMVYYPDQNSLIPEDYKMFNLQTSLMIEDDSKNVLILHEALFDEIWNYKKVQFVFLWLSVDNFFTHSKRYLSVQDYFKWKPSYLLELFIWRSYQLFKNRKNYFFKNLSLKTLAKKDIVHLYQSTYAQHFLLNKGFDVVYPFKEPINEHFFDHNHNIEKENIVLYNPKKGYKFTKKLMESAPNIKWIPLQNMNRAAVKEHLLKAKVYIDFGFHPGRDRIPREAAASGCCIITGKRGSARYYEDVTIPNEYKFQESAASIPGIIAKIENIFSQYDTHFRNFECYRYSIKIDTRNFRENIDRVFKIADHG